MLNSVLDYGRNHSPLQPLPGQIHSRLAHALVWSGGADIPEKQITIALIADSSAQINTRLLSGALKLAKVAPDLVVGMINCRTNQGFRPLPLSGL